jgi:phage terminase large subunit
MTGELPIPRTRKAALDEMAFWETELLRLVAPERIERSLPAKVQPILQPARYKGLHGGRGGTKSHSFARLLIAKALREPGLRWVCAREIQLSLRDSVKRLLEDTITKFSVGDRFGIYDARIDTPGDGVIIFQGLQNHTAESIKSLEGFDGVWVEEAQSLSERSLKLLRPTIREDDSELWFSWNPEKPTDPIDQLLRGAMPPSDAVVIEVNHSDNPNFPDVLRHEMEIDYARDPESAAHVWGGKYATRSKATVFKNWRVAAFETPQNAAFLFGGDWGFSVDPTVLVRGFVAEGQFLFELKQKFGVGERVLCIDAAVYQVGCEIDDTPALFDNIDPARPGMARNWEIVADSARPETISYMQRHGYPRIVAARKGAGSVEEGVKFLQSYDVVVHPSCCHQCGDGKNHVVDEFENYKYKVHPLTGEVLPVLEDKKNHVIDADRYMVEKLHQESWVTW